MSCHDSCVANVSCLLNSIQKIFEKSYFREDINWVVVSIICLVSRNVMVIPLPVDILCTEPERSEEIKGTEPMRECYVYHSIIL